jgi:hypothetical protein
MSDHEAETTEATWENNGSHSANGSDPGSIAVATDETADSGLDDRAKFLTDLTRVMQSTAATEAARNAEGTEQRRKAHLATIRARESAEADELRELAKIDIKDIDAWSDEEVKRIKAERERRIATRREQLQHRLEEHRAVISREIDSVEAAVGAYRVKVDAFFARINTETDPVAIAREAGNQPQFPDLEAIGPFAVASASDDGPAAGEEAIVADAVAEQVIDGGSDDGAVTEVAEASAETVEGSGEETGEDQPMVGVMDPDAGTGTFETPWVSGSDEGGDEAHEGQEGQEGQQGAEELVAVEAVVASEGAEGEGSEGDGSGIEEGAEELTAVAADADDEARVVMPRSSGAGSWLRWPNSSSGGDSNR